MPKNFVLRTILEDKKNGFHVGIVSLQQMIWALRDQSMFRVQQDPFLWKIFINISLWSRSPGRLKLLSDPVLWYQRKFILTAFQDAGSVTPMIGPLQVENWSGMEEGVSYKNTFPFPVCLVNHIFFSVPLGNCNRITLCLSLCQCGHA